MKNLFFIAILIGSSLALFSCGKETSTTIIQEKPTVIQPKEEDPGVQFKVKSGEGGVEVDVEGKVETEKK